MISVGGLSGTSLSSAGPAVATDGPMSTANTKVAANIAAKMLSALCECLTYSTMTPSYSWDVATAATIAVVLRSEE